jgi:hypothetical protein
VRLILAFLILVVAPLFYGDVSAEGDMSLEVAKFLLEKAPDQARAIAVTRPGERFTISKQPCGTLPPKSRVSEILSKTIKEAAWPEVIECIRAKPGFKSTAEALNSQYHSAGFQRKISKAKSLWLQEVGDSDVLRDVSIPEIRIMDLAVKLSAVKKIVSMARSCDAEFVNANFEMDLALLKPILVEN